MKFKNNFKAIVINGLWNSSVFSPDWVSKYLLPQESNIEVEVALDSMNYTPIKLSTKELSILPASNQLSFVALQTDDATFTKIGAMAAKTARLLVHTPVNALGINFIFESDENEIIKNIFLIQDIHDLNMLDELTLKDTKITRTFEGKDYTLNLSIEKKEAKYIFDFNYHFEINALEKFNEIFDIQKFMELKEYSINLLSKLYQMEMEF